MGNARAFRFVTVVIALSFVFSSFFCTDIGSEDTPSFTDSDLKEYADKPVSERSPSGEEGEAGIGEASDLQDKGAIFKTGDAAVVAVFSLSGEGKTVGHGSGFIVSPDGAIVTSYHVVSNSARIKIRAGGGIFDVQGLIYSDPQNDLAMLKVKGDNLPVARLGDSDVIREGDPVYVISSPGGSVNVVSRGVFKGPWDLGGSRRVLRITAPFSEGGSGGPVFNEAGEVIGVATFVVREAETFRKIEGLNFAAPVNLIKDKLSGRSGVIELKDAWVGDRRESPDYWIGIGNDLNRRGRYDEAAEAFKKALSVSPDSAGALNGLGVAYMKLRRSKEAIKVYTKVLEIEPSAWSYSNLGLVYIEAGKYKEAVDVLEKAVGMSQELEAAYLNLGLAYRQLGRLAEAARTYKKAIGINGSSAEAHFGLGLVELDLNNKEAAIDEYRSLKSLDPALAERLLKFINR